ncbi:DNA-binding protein WhiA [Mycolicibacterium sp.]|uniref:DNA-binding protein WhiA n=1 Tax=Mycolicibacterium sp. TaxID=2320850 RepID=UPI0035603B00
MARDPLTDTLTAELVSAVPPHLRAARAEAAGMLRFGDALRVASSEAFIEATLAAPGAGQRLASLLARPYGIAPEVLHPGLGGHVVRVHAADGAGTVMREYGLLDRRDRPVIGLSPALVSAVARDADVAAGVVRGTVLAAGCVRMGRGGAAVLKVPAPGLAAALALIGAIRKLGATGKVHERHSDLTILSTVVVRDFDGLHPLLVALGAPEFADGYVDIDASVRREKRDARLSSANHERASAAGRAAVLRVRSALDTLGDSVPPELAAVAELRLQHPTVTLAELGRLCAPPATKNAVAGRLRRLVLAADEARSAYAAATVPTGLPADARATGT